MKRTLSAALAVLTLIMMLPAISAKAVTLPGMTSKVDYENTDPNRYIIDIDLVNQVITVYDNRFNARGEIVLQGLCTTGNKENPTGAGTFRVGDLKERFGYFVAFGQYAQYWTQVVRGIYIHSVMYDSKKLSSMSSSAYRNLGKAVSHGCIRVLPHIAQWIFYNCPPGTTVRVDRKRERDPALVAKLKAEMPTYRNYRQPVDGRQDPPLVPAIVTTDNVPLRTGFSASRDRTLATLSRGDRIKLLQIGPDWVKAETSKGKLGYIKTQYILCYPDQINYYEAYAATRKTYVYGSMSTSSKRLATIYSGEEVQITENPKSGWYYGSFNGVTGYMRTKYVKLQTLMRYPELGAIQPQVPENNIFGTSDPAVFEPAQSVMSGRKTAAIRTDLIANFRDRPSTAGNIIGELMPGTPVIILAKEGSWYHIEAEGKRGYVNEICVDH